MPVQQFADTTPQDERAPKGKRRFKDDVVMLVVGAEEQRILIHQTEEGSYTITGENTVKDLRDAGIDVEQWVAIGYIAPLGELAVRAEDGIVKDSMFEDGGPSNEDDEGEDLAPVELPPVAFNDELTADEPTPGIAGQTVPDVENVVLAKAKLRKPGKPKGTKANAG